MIIYENDKVLDLSEKVFGEKEESVLIKLISNKNYEEAINVLNKAIVLEPNNPNHYTNMSLCHLHNGNKNEAIQSAEKAVSLNSDPLYLNNLGLAYKNVDMPEKAIEIFKKIMKVTLDPYSMSNLATAYSDILDINTSIEYLKSAISLSKNDNLSGTHVNLAHCYHFNKLYDKAWEEYEHRMSYFPQMLAYIEKFGIEKKWNGKDDIKDKRILLFCEQGYGDIIQFIRFIPELKSKGCYIIACCPLNLISLIEPLVDEVLVKELIRTVKISNYDYHIATMSLPYLLKIDVNSFVGKYDFEFKPYPISGTKKFKIGICWQGSKKHKDDAKRSVNLSKFYEISQIIGVQLYSLQKNHKDRADCKIMNVIDHMDDMNDFKDTAGLIGAMDLVISVDTAILHLAGAIGKESWGLLAYKPDWRWGLKDIETFWYPSIKLIRQKERGNWNTVFEEVKNELRRINKIA